MKIVSLADMKVGQSGVVEALEGRGNIQHRLVYEVFAEERVVHVLRMWTHYE